MRCVQYCTSSCLSSTAIVFAFCTSLYVCAVTSICRIHTLPIRALSKLPCASDPKASGDQHTGATASASSVSGLQIAFCTHSTWRSRSGQGATGMAHRQYPKAEGAVVEVDSLRFGKLPTRQARRRKWARRVGPGYLYCPSVGIHRLPTPSRGGLMMSRGRVRTVRISGTLVASQT